jgi:hypothetical protein
MDIVQMDFFQMEIVQIGVLGFIQKIRVEIIIEMLIHIFSNMPTRCNQ